MKCAYTGLEFGIAGFQPYDPNNVWANHYGGCKDKANLLRTMLAAKGILSFLALVNASTAGEAQEQSPDYRCFDHVIVAIPTPSGGWLFCDPTIKFARPGMLSPGDADRDVLVLKGADAQFVHTPAQSQEWSVMGWI